jgi:hypothetical protein
MVTMKSETLGLSSVGSLKPSPVTGSVGDSCIVRALGKAVKVVEVARDWSRCLKRITDPSPRPTAR